MPKLTDKQLVILNAAAGRDDRRALPLPASLKLAKAPGASLLASLVKCGLLGPRPATREDEVWREDGDQRLTLIVSDAGLAALCIDPKDHAKPQKGTPGKLAKSRKGFQSETVATDMAPQPGTKLATLVDLLRRDGGTTLAESMDATGWQRHTVRAALTRLRQRGLAIERVKSETGETVYKRVGG